MSSTSFPVFTIVFVAFLLAGGLIAIGRKPRREPVSIASGTAWYLYTAMATSATLALEGLALLVKVIIGFVNTQLSGYTSQAFNSFSGLGSSGGLGGSSGFGGSSLPSAPGGGVPREQDLILALILIAVGVAIFLFTRRMSTDLDPVFSGSPEWRAWATPLLTALVYGLAGIGAFIAAVFAMADNVLVDHSQTGPDQFGSSLGFAIAFLPAWAYLVRALYRYARGGSSGSAAAAPVSPYAPPSAPAPLPPQPPYPGRTAPPGPPERYQPPQA